MASQLRGIPCNEMVLVFPVSLYCICNLRWKNRYHLFQCDQYFFNTKMQEMFELECRWRNIAYIIMRTVWIPDVTGG